MVFSSLLFLFLFLPVVLFLYYVSPYWTKNLVLFFMSLFFYAWGEPVYVILMIFSTIVDYVHGRLVDQFQKKGEQRKAKVVVASSVCINLGLLGFFKYAGTGVALPIGISFYTFQTMSYTIDVYRRQAPIQRNLINFGTYVALFPQLIAGPIVRYQTIAKELTNRRVNFSMVADGIQRFIIGLGKKVLLANQIGQLWEQYLEQISGQLTTLGAWIGMSAFAFQIYFDFSGYSDMAIGLGYLLGFHFPENFQYPYEAVSITDFWRRWHISLGTWFREYVYIPLGGNQRGQRRQIFNLLVVWMLTGIWHGASLNFLYWGVYFGILLILEKMVYGKFLEKFPKAIQHFYGIFFIWFGWVIFALEDERKILFFIENLLGIKSSIWATQNDWYLLSSYWLLFLLLIIGCTSIPRRSWTFLKQKIGEESAIVYIMEQIFLVSVFLISIAYLVEATYNPFLYFRF